MKKTEDSKKPSVEQILALASFIAGIFEEVFTSGQIQYWLQNKSKLRKKVLEMFLISDDVYAIRKEWEQFYLKTLDLTVDFSTVRIPNMPQDGKKWRLLFIAAGITQNQIFDSWTFSKWKYTDDLDKTIPYHARNTSVSYAIWVLDDPEPDTETLGKSTRQADPKSIKKDFKDLSGATGITSIERMIFESKYFDETGKNLDIKGLTFCSGSRDSDGDVPCVYGVSGGRVRVDCYGVDYLDSVYGVRGVIS